ncbi:unnamed protein product [Mytilus edulis]|uniref:Uncharacterized protein n=1 Tax=Mytilus edulis TaxID=6550 RepID=A0A8S3RI46_MYTED|nr:unnamed protein product [Mytilus edulis]
MDGVAWDIAIIPGSNEAVVTLPFIKSVQFVNITHMTQGKVTKVPDECYGVTVIKDMIVLGGMGKVYFLSMTGRLMKTFIVGSGYLYSLKTGKMDMIYCCEADKNTIICIDISGTVMFSFQSLSGFDEAIDMALDDKDNVYVTTWQTNKVHRLSKDLKLIDIPLKKEDGLDEPFGIAFNKNYTKLFIANGWNHKKKVLTFDCV